jgi:predicted CoA-substrate-specific enzyme activase
LLTAGVDVGSLTAKAVVYDAAGRVVLGRSLLQLAHDPAAAGREAFAAALTAAGVQRKAVAVIVATGYGRIAVDFADRRITEISCHGCGVHHMLPAVRTVVDVGGQDCKVISLDEAGRALDFEMNDRCAAGTGRFLEVMAGALGTDLPGLAELALASAQPASLSSTCTVFAESEVIGLLAEGTAHADLAAGLCLAVAQRVAALGARLGVVPPVAFTGGVALNAGVRRALESVLGVTVAVPPEPQLTGALGAAVLAAQRDTPQGESTVP